MPEIRLRKNGTTYHLEWCGSGAPCEERFALHNGKLYYVPAMSTQGTKVLGGIYNSLRWYYDTSSPTIAFRKNGKTYYCNKSFITEQAISYDIPAGTYTPSTFLNMISNYITKGGSRTCKNSFTVLVRNQPVGVPAGTTIYYTDPYPNRSSRWNTIGFGTNTTQLFKIVTSFATYKSYIVYSQNNEESGNYSNYSITVVTGINFN